MWSQKRKETPAHVQCSKEVYLDSCLCSLSISRLTFLLVELQSNPIKLSPCTYIIMIHICRLSDISLGMLSMIHAITFPDYPGVSQLRTETPVLLYRSPDLLDTKKRTFTTFFKLIFLGKS